MHLEDFDYSEKTYPYFVTICCDKSTTYFVNDKFASIVRDAIEFNNDSINTVIYCYTIMPDHVHIVMALQNPYKGNLQKWVSSFKSYTTKFLKSNYGVERLWQTNFYEHVVRKGESLVEIIQYVLNNPVRKGLVDKWQDHPYTKILVNPVI